MDQGACCSPGTGGNFLADHLCGSASQTNSAHERARQVFDKIERNREQIAHGAFHTSVPKGIGILHHVEVLSTAIVRHHDLQNLVNQIRLEFGAEIRQRANEHASKECPVCLEPLGTVSDVVKTTCGHSYHFKCIVETLADGTVRSCPLCRTDIAELADHSTCDGKIFSLMCLVRIFFDRTQAATRFFRSHVQRELTACLFVAKHLQSARVFRRFQKQRWREFDERISCLLLALDCLELAAEANALGFQDICVQLHSITGADTSRACYSLVNNLDCFRDGSLRHESAPWAHGVQHTQDLHRQHSEDGNVSVLDAAPAPGCEEGSSAWGGDKAGRSRTRGVALMNYAAMRQAVMKMVEDLQLGKAASMAKHTGSSIGWSVSWRHAAEVEVKASYSWATQGHVASQDLSDTCAGCCGSIPMDQLPLALRDAHQLHQQHTQMLNQALQDPQVRQYRNTLTDPGRGHVHGRPMPRTPEALRPHGLAGAPGSRSHSVGCFG